NIATEAPEFPKEHYLNASKGWKSWALTVDHKRIGLMYLVSVLTFFMLGGLFALLVRLELFLPGAQFFEQKTYNQLFTLHGVVMVFLFIIPSIPAALGNFFLPLQLGAKDVAFPKMNLFSFYIYAVGAVVAIVAMITGAVDTG